MLTPVQIRDLLSDVLIKYPIKKLSLFGSYAEGRAGDDSDIDLLVEFLSPNVSLFMLSDMKDEIESKLDRKVDLIHAPVDGNSLLRINEVVDIYGQTGKLICLKDNNGPPRIRIDTGMK